MSGRKKTSVISVQDIDITIATFNMDDYICIIDMAKAKGGESRAADIIKNWIRGRATLEFLGTWEMMFNPDFKVVEFDHFKSQAGLPTFTLSAKQWIEKTGAIGIYVQAGRYGGTYAHRDIAFEFGSAISPVFKLYLIKEYQRLKDAENDLHKLEWNAKRFLSKTNYLIHTDAVKKYVLPQSNFTKQTEWIAYADEADLLNVALFGTTASEWRKANPELAKNSNIRDYASVNELTVLSNLETHNAELIKEAKRLSQCYKSLFAVPNHLTEQWAAEFLRLYPSANILVATKKDFEMRNRKKFCAKIATGDYDAVIIGHSQLEKIPMSRERQERQIREQIWELEEGIRELKASRGDNFSIKQLERTKRSLNNKLTKLLDSKKRDDVVTFEQLGCDRLYIDEAHNFKDLQCKGYFK